MKIGIVGSGRVGSTTAYALIMRGVGSEIVLVDKDVKRAKAEAADLLHAVPFANPMRVRAGEYADLAGAAAVIIAAGVTGKRGETPLKLLSRNAKVFQEVVPRILQAAPTAILVVATNPVDIMTHLTARYAAELGVPGNRVIGSGTMLDTARFRAILGRRVGVDTRHVHGYVVGEHGDSEVIAWSRTTIGGTALEEFCAMNGIRLDSAVRHEIDAKVRYAGHDIIDGKGAIFFGIGSALAQIISAVINDRRAIMTVSTPMEDVAGVHDVSVSMPHLISGDGILARFPLRLTDQEQGRLSTSAKIVKEAIETLDEAMAGY